jgi:isoleucyl-tRNA synthetase
MAARNQRKIKARQPLHKMVVHSNNPNTLGAFQRFSRDIAQEVNVEKLSLDFSPTFAKKFFYQPDPLKKKLGPKFGPKLNAVLDALAKVQFEALVFLQHQGQTIKLMIGDETVEVEPADFTWRLVHPPGEKWSPQEDWVGASDKDTQVLLDVFISENLEQAGLAREVVRHVQDSRKGANLKMEDRIELHLATGSAKLQQAIEAHRGYIAGETLTTRWAEGPLNGEAYQAKVSVDGQPLTIQLRKLAARA